MVGFMDEQIRGTLIEFLEGTVGVEELEDLVLDHVASPNLDLTAREVMHVVACRDQFTDEEFREEVGKLVSLVESITPAACVLAASEPEVITMSVNLTSPRLIRRQLRWACAGT